MEMNRARYYLWSAAVESILRAIREGQTQVAVSADLSRSVSTFAIQGDRVLFDADNVLNEQQLLEIAKKPQRVFILEGNEIRLVERRDTHYYKLVPTEGAPTVEIDGVKMHRSKGIDPFDDAKEKAREVVRAGHRVLDTCGGLGYTAIWALRLGARHVVSVERDDNIQELRRENPWSQELYNPNIQLVSADVFEYIQTLEPAAFDSILHDPPRFSFAGELYGEEFYRQLYRVLVRGGGLFHYTGTPYIARRGNSFLANAAKRLQSVGFSKVLPREAILGVKAIK
jgi:predicted methyltransferase